MTPPAVARPARPISYLAVVMALAGMAAVVLPILVMPAVTSLHSTRVLLVFAVPAAAAAAVLVAISRTGALSPLDRLAGFALARSEAAWAVGALVALAAVSAAVSGFGSRYLSQDEWSMLLQARLFAAGHLTGSVPVAAVPFAFPEGIQNWWILVSQSTGDFMSPYWPAWAAITAPFAAVGAPWLAAPAMGSVAVVAAGRLAALVAGPSAAAPARLLLLASSAFVLTAGTMLSGTADMALNLVTAYLVVRGGRGGLLAAGLVGSVALNLHNPLPHVAFMAPIGIWLLTWPEGRRRIPWLIPGYLPGLALAAGWTLITAAAIPDPGPVVNGVGTLYAITKTGILARIGDLGGLVLLAVPGLLIMAWRGARIRGGHPALRVLAASMLVTAAAYALYPYSQGFGFGARYLHSALGVLPVLAAAWWVQAAKPEQDGARALAAIGAAVSIALAVLAANWTAGMYPVLPQGAADVAFTAGSADRALLDPIGPVLVMEGRGEAADRDLVLSLWPGAVMTASGPDGSLWRMPASAAGDPWRSR
jgi:hypothetical protein